MNQLEAFYFREREAQNGLPFVCLNLTELPCSKLLFMVMLKNAWEFSEKVKLEGEIIEVLGKLFGEKK